MTKKTRDLLEDVLTENQQAIQMTSINTEILSSMMGAFASVIPNNLNGVMKALAALTIIFNVPTIVASFYGMNVYLPGESHPLAYLGVMGLALGLTALATVFFIKGIGFNASRTFLRCQSHAGRRSRLG
ncbi:MAG: hypothetical protein IPG44_17385 [Anaerolineales bacterium]|nr:hypothetical protein [Anaerolineales bacterium]